MSIDRALQRWWYGEFRLALLPLIPLSWLFAAIVAVRRAAYRYGVLRSHRVAAPVIVVGNLTVGGTGKTPFTIWLADQLAARGLNVGVVLRGYGGVSTAWPRQVTRGSSWHEVGDEACLIAMRTSAIVVAGPDRVADARLAIELGAQVVLSDDGLQHYRLARDAEILVMDGTRRLGNGRLLPAGPLRESASRLRSVDLRVITQRSSPQGSEQPSIERRIPTVVARPTVSVAVNLVNGESQPLASFAGRPVHAVAAIGHPEGFFDALRALGLQVRGHAFPDHARLAREHIVFDDAAPVLMTEKDAVKCAAIADERHWAVPLHLELNAADTASVSRLLERIVRKAP